MKFNLFFSALFVVLVSNTLLAQQATIHPQALSIQLQNTAFKTAKDKVYLHFIEEVQEAKEGMLKAKVAIEEAHRLTYKKLTEVNDGIKEAKKIYYTTQAIVRITNMLQSAHEHALGIRVFDRYRMDVEGSLNPNGQTTLDTTYTPIWKNPILPLHIKYNRLIIDRCMNLANYIKDFVIAEKKGQQKVNEDGSTIESASGIISNIVRERFLSNVYQKVYTLEVITKSYLYGIKTAKWQFDANNIIPYQMFINDDKIILNRIKSRLNF